MISFTIEGTPVPDARPRAWKGRVLTPKRQRQEAARIRQIAAAAMGKLPPLEGPLHLSLTFTYQWPKARKDSHWRPSRPDLDNLIKLICDASNGTLWLDDAQIVAVNATKGYGEVPGVSVIVTPLLGEGNADGTALAVAGGSPGD